MRFGGYTLRTLFLPLIGQLDLELGTLLLRSATELVQVFGTRRVMGIADRAGTRVGEVVTGAPIGIVHGHLRLQAVDEVLELHLATNGAGQLAANLAQLILQIGQFGVQQRVTTERAIAHGFRRIEGNGRGGRHGVGPAGQRRGWHGGRQRRAAALGDLSARGFGARRGDGGFPAEKVADFVAGGLGVGLLLLELKRTGRSLASTGRVYTQRRRAVGGRMQGHRLRFLGGRGQQDRDEGLADEATVQVIIRELRSVGDVGGIFVFVFVFVLLVVVVAVLEVAIRG